MLDDKSLHLIRNCTLTKSTQSYLKIAPRICAPLIAAHRHHSSGNLPRGASKIASLQKLPQVTQPTRDKSIPQVTNQARHRQSARYITIDRVINRGHSVEGDTSESNVFWLALSDANAEDWWHLVSERRCTRGSVGGFEEFIGGFRIWYDINRHQSRAVVPPIKSEY